MAESSGPLESLLQEELSAGTLAALQQFLREQAPTSSPEDPATSAGADRGTGAAAGGAGDESHGAGQTAGGGPGEAEEESMFREQWGLSQFWYEDSTSDAVADEVLRISGNCSLRVACVACPTLFRSIRRRLPASLLTSTPEGGRFPCPPTLQLLEYDRRFGAFGSCFTFYDYCSPADIPAHLHHHYDVVVADPPYLSQECLEKTAITMRLLAREPGAEGEAASAQDGEAVPPAKLLLLTGAVMEPIALELLGLRPCQFRPQHKSKLGNEFRLFSSYEPPASLGGWDPEAAAAAAVGTSTEGAS